MACGLGLRRECSPVCICPPGDSSTSLCTPSLLPRYRGRTMLRMTGLYVLLPSLWGRGWGRGSRAQPCRCSRQPFFLVSSSFVCTKEEVHYSVMLNTREQRRGAPRLYTAHAEAISAQPRRCSRCPFFLVAFSFGQAKEKVQYHVYQVPPQLCSSPTWACKRHAWTSSPTCAWC